MGLCSDGGRTAISPCQWKSGKSVNVTRFRELVGDLRLLAGLLFVWSMPEESQAELHLEIQ